MTIEPDTKDWTWVLHRPCPDCGLDASGVDPGTLPSRLRQSAGGWAAVLARDDARVRPAPHTWSPLEYACHVRDVHRVMGHRLKLMLREDDPLFPSWDQDVAAVDGRYLEQDPDQVNHELTAAAEAVAAGYAGVSGSAWDRPGRRGDGARFSVAGFGQYHLHDVVHHLHDVHR